MTTAELGLVTTAVVGVAAAASPALTSLANRKHERAQARSQRRYEQRKQTYLDLAQILEQERLASYHMDLETTFFEISEEVPSPQAWVDVLGHVSIMGSSTVQTKIEAYREAADSFYPAVGNLTMKLHSPRHVMLSSRRSRKPREPCATSSTASKGPGGEPYA
jgi:hypothetical protein